MPRLLFLLSVIFFLASCNETKTQVSSEEKVDIELQNLFSLMEGSYNSANQAAVDSDYFDISLHMYPIWEDKGMFFYVEQALNKMQDRPYRQ